MELLEVKPDELARWDEMTRRLAVPFHEDRIISQFAGYGELEELDWIGYAERYGDLQRLDRILEAEGDSTNRYKVSKQADVLMLFYLLPPEELVQLFGRLGYSLDPSVDLPRTIDYYLRRTSHGSTLSRMVHAWVLARFDRPRSWDLFTQSLDSDIADVQRGSTAGGSPWGHGRDRGSVAALLRRCSGAPGLPLRAPRPSPRRWPRHGLHHRIPWPAHSPVHQAGRCVAVRPAGRSHADPHDNRWRGDAARARATSRACHRSAGREAPMRQSPGESAKPRAAARQWLSCPRAHRHSAGDGGGPPGFAPPPETDLTSEAAGRRSDGSMSRSPAIGDRGWRLPGMAARPHE